MSLLFQCLPFYCSHFAHIAVSCFLSQQLHDCPTQNARPKLNCMLDLQSPGGQNNSIWMLMLLWVCLLTQSHNNVIKRSMSIPFISFFHTGVHVFCPFLWFLFPQVSFNHLCLLLFRFNFSFSLDFLVFGLTDECLFCHILSFFSGFCFVRQSTL